ncbi:MAG: molybdenum ABC transporter permease [Chloroflexi bacterium HGW-Chloroflexi-10]|jgi:molybdate/tungstate transport system permease protein|nr:MAG: molybdenum ABC transporter permease [Chloroflexi bacterium HGW-Chloroflexi-10]
MKRYQRSFRFVFGAAALGLMIFLLAPLLQTVVSTNWLDFYFALQDEQLLRSIRVTFGAALLATILGLIGGVPLAFLLARRVFRGRRLVQAFVNLPVIIPHTAAGVSLLLVFGRYGWLGRGFGALGITFTDSIAGITVAMAFVSLPYLVNAAREAFAMTSEELELAATVDGASAWQAFWLVTLPQAWRGILSGAVMMWARGVSEFGAIVILAYHPKVVPVLVYERFESFGLSAALPVALFLLIIALVVFGLLNFVILPGDKKQ